MEPNQNVNNLQNTTSADTTSSVPNMSNASAASAAPSKPDGNLVFRDKPKKNTGMILGMVLLGILAIGGIGFGVWAMMDGNSQLAKKDEQIADLDRQLAEKTSPIVENNTMVVEDDNTVSLENPIIKATSPARYRVTHGIPVYIEGSSNDNTMNFSSTDGGDITCSISNMEGGNCSVSGVPDGVYKIVTLHEGNGIGSEKVGFIMNDGTVWYTSLYNDNVANPGLVRTMQASKVNIDGFVKDVVEINYTSDINSPVGGGFSSVFVLSDNSLVKYDNSLFK